MKNKFKEQIISAKKSGNFIMQYVRKHIILIIIYTAIGMSGAVVGLLSSLVSRDLVDIITGHMTGALIKTFVAMIMLQIITVAINNVSSFISAKITLKIGNEIKSNVYDRIMETDWESLTKFHSGNIVSRWSGDTTVVSQGILSTVPNTVIHMFRFIAAFCLVVKNDWTFAAIAILSVPITFFVSKSNLKRMKKINMANYEFSAKMSSFTQESFSGIQNIKALDMVGIYCRKLKELQKQQVSLSMTYQKVNIVNSIIMTIVAQATTYTIYGWGIYKVWSGSISYGTMTMFLGLSQSLSSTLQNMINLVPSTISVLNAVSRIREIVDLPKEDYSGAEDVKKFNEKYGHLGIGIRVKDVDFAYMSGTEVLKSAGFEANPREVVGIVGPSGEGKTTILRLILAIVNAKNGSAVICEGDNENHTFPLKASTRQLMSYVPQGNSMFPETIAENMRLVKEDATDDEIIEALKMACAWNFVSKLPEGIHTTLKERGAGLSEGQAQRLSIARALLRKTPILLLDEATSALDQDNSRKVLENIRNDRYPRTVIITTHRPEVMEICDRIYSINSLNLSEKR